MSNMTTYGSGAGTGPYVGIAGNAINVTSYERGISGPELGGFMHFAGTSLGNPLGRQWGSCK
jgi:hypothetical protein